MSDKLRAVIEKIERDYATHCDESARLWRIANDECEPGDYDPENDAEPGSIKAYERAEDFTLDNQAADLHLSTLLTAAREHLTHERLEYLRGELRGECISWSELNELQRLADHIKPGDVELLEAAGVSEEQARAEGRL